MEASKRKLGYVLKFSLRGALGFGIGGLFVVAMEWFLFARRPDEIMPAYYIFIAYFLCGAIGAIILLWGLEGALRGAAGFGCGFVITAFLVMFTMLSLQASAGPEYGWGATGCGIGFALGGGVGGLFVRRELALVGALAFGIAGAVWGPIMFWHFWQRKGGLLLSWTDYSGILMIVFPYLLGGALFGAALGYLTRKN